MPGVRAELGSVMQENLRKQGTALGGSRSTGFTAEPAVRSHTGLRGLERTGREQQVPRPVWVGKAEHPS